MTYIQTYKKPDVTQIYFWKLGHTVPTGIKNPKTFVSNGFGLPVWLQKRFAAQRNKTWVFNMYYIIHKFVQYL